MKKQYFNLIEIMLALGVISIGMSSILVLFPVGLNSSNSATADNSLPDAVQYIAGYLETRIRSEWDTAAGRASSTLNGLSTSKPADNAVFETFNTTPVTDTPIYSSETAGLFKYEQTRKINEVDVSDFAAAARVWKAANYIHVEGQSDAVPMPNGSATIFIEVSYPLTKPYSERETQIYRFDLYDYGA